MATVTVKLDADLVIEVTQPRRPLPGPPDPTIA
jgi:hypothetical protein